MSWSDALASRVRRVYSQTGEEGILEAIFESIGTTNKYLVDIGAGDGTLLSNTRLFLESGWHGARFDANYAKDVNQERITAENICDVLAKYNVPGEFDLLSLDIDGIDWYVLRALLRNYHPRAFVCEVNPCIPAAPPVAVEYDPNFTFSDCLYFGASLSAFRMLAEAYGYVLVYVHESFNAFFVQRDRISELGPPGAIVFAVRNSWPPDSQNRPWHIIGDNEVP